MSSKERQFTRNPEYIFRKIIEETILVPIHQDVADLQCIYTLNEVGAFLWECMAQQQTQQELVKAVLAEYDATPKQVAKDVEQFLEELSACGAILEV